ncbi:glutamyl-tRNA synthetase [Mumia flava]|uniref:Glutamate--tRNA ligase n=1 Tax=Mumia flava TaxID=1348852 RepID=A0A0B2BBN1_9ACTN|nr:glutamate--tRNA ligase [Mumia flava]PJJ53875.1 glutamyl-tRNA synthetase [Mumia flava]
MTESNAVRVRFCPSPTGNLHVGNVRTALFNWAFARHHGGTFVFRVEDTDAARDSEESYQGLIASLRWLGLDWDEGPEVGGDLGPYRQSQRMDTYAEVVEKLIAAGYAYYAYDTPEELEERREQARAEGRSSGYDGLHRDLTAEQRAEFEATGRKPVVRFRMPDEPITFDDLVRGEVTFDPEHVSDYVIMRANGQPLYTLTNPVDDAAMGITHVLRGEDLLSSTPRQIPLHRALVALGIGEGVVPQYGHLPFVMGPGNRKLSKRDPGGGLDTYRERGFLPEGLLNYLALLGWSIGGDRELFSLAEMAEAFEIERVNPNPAQFDLKKCEAINAQHIRELDVSELAGRLVPYLTDAGLLGPEPTSAELELLAQATPLVNERITVLSEAVDMLAFLFVGDATFRVDPDDAAKLLTEDGLGVVRAAHDALAGLETFDTPSIEQALRDALVEGLGLKPRHAFGPVRVAVSGRRISPPLFESIELLGKERTLTRLAAALGGGDA